MTACWSQHTAAAFLFFATASFLSFLRLARPIFVNSIAMDSSGKIWLGTDANKGISGIFRLDNSKAERITAPTANVWPLAVDDTGVWAGTARYGLFHIRRWQDRTKASHLKTRRADCVQIRSFRSSPTAKASCGSAQIEASADMIRKGRCNRQFQTAPIVIS